MSVDTSDKCIYVQCIFTYRVSSNLSVNILRKIMDFGTKGVFYTRNKRNRRKGNKFREANEHAHKHTHTHNRNLVS